jgi:phosphate transport system substrate-binding protein
MGGIINDVAAYRNHHEAIGFSFRYFTEEMFKNGDIKLLSIDGIAPTIENIQNGSYPFLSDFGIITVRPHSENTQKLVDFFFSPAGQELIEKTGYVPLKERKSVYK